jgi:proline utilization trans-activator
MGLNLNVPDGLYSNPLAREHRTRLWWTAYTLDRTCCSKLGHPASIADDDILVDYPSGDLLDASTDFEDVDYARKSLELARLSQQTRQQLYSRRKHHVPFAQRVQTTLKNITKWMETLPPRLQWETDRVSVQPNSVVYLHLRFNQVSRTLHRIYYTLTALTVLHYCDAADLTPCVAGTLQVLD